MIYHEHISTFSVQPVARAFLKRGLEVFDAERIPTKGGSIRFWVQLAGGPRPIEARVAELIALERNTGLYDLAYHRKFSEKIADIKRKLHEVIDQTLARGQTVGAYGTSVGCAALIHQFELENRLAFLFDDTPFKDRLEGPGYDLPVHQAGKLAELNPGLVVILAWRYADVIISKHSQYLGTGGRMVVPLPSVQFVGGSADET